MIRVDDRARRPDLRHHLDTALPRITRNVEKHFRTRLDGVAITITITDTEGLTQLALDAALHFAPDATKPARASFARHNRTETRTAVGSTFITRSGVHIALDATRLKPGPDLDIVLAHELVHAAQLSQPDVRTGEIAAARNNLGIEPLTRSQARAANRAVAKREREAYRLEKKLAR